MGARSKLRLALAAEKGVDFQKVKQKRKHKAAVQLQKNNLGGATTVRQDEDDHRDESPGDSQDDDGIPDAAERLNYNESNSAERNGRNLAAIDESDTSDSSVDFEGNGEEEEEEDIPVSDLEDLDEEDKDDLIPHTRLTINNTAALLASLKRISISTDKSTLFAFHQSITSSAVTADSIPDVSDDLQRELAFYSQSLEAARRGRTKLRAEGVPFSRPKDYFAEMVKEDAHMEKVKAKLVEEASAKKASAEARKLRDLKKFGKQVQVAKLQERQKAKRETLDKIKVLKRKRQESGGDIGTKEADLFDVGVESELTKHSQRSGSGRGQMGGNAANGKRQKKNEKYGFGGKKRHAKSGDAMSSGDLSGFNARKMKDGAKGGISKASRPGKSRRKAMAISPR